MCMHISGCECIPLTVLMCRSQNKLKCPFTCSTLFEKGSRVLCCRFQGTFGCFSVFSWLPVSFAEGALALQRQVTAAGTPWLLSTLTQVFRQSQEEVCPLSHLLRSIATKFYVTCLSEPQRFTV